MTTDSRVGTVDTVDAVEAVRWRRVLGVIALPWALSRLLAAAVVLAAPSYPFSDGVKLTGFWSRWDGAFYLAIAREGYGMVDTRFPRWAFFPGLPSLLRVLGELGGEADKIGLFVINQLAVLAALGGVYVLACRHATNRAAVAAVWLLAFFPASFVFSMGYPAALFLACSVWAFVLVEDGHDVTVGLLAAATTMLRPSGAIVVVALVVAVRTVRRAAFVVAPSVAALVTWLIYCHVQTGDALVFWSVKSHWEEIGIADVVGGTVKWSLLPHVALGLVALGAVLYERRRLPASWVVFAVLYLLLPLLTGMVGLGRYANECFPPFVALGMIFARFPRWVLVVGVASCAIGIVLFGTVVGRYELVP